MRRSLIHLLMAALLTAGLLACTAAAQTADRPTLITLGSVVTIDGPGASADGAQVLISEAGSYRLSGTLADGSVEVSVPGGSVTLILDGVDIHHSEGPAILIKEAADATVVLADGSVNVLADGGASEYDAALYSAASLTLQGEGALRVHAVYEGISSTEHIHLLSGTIHVWADEDGLNANQDGVSQINVSGGYLYVQTATGDGIDSNGTITISGGTVITQAALVDANSGLDADGAVTITGGTVIATGSAMMGGLATTEWAQGALIVDYGATQAAGTLIVVRDEDGNELLAFAPANGYQQLLFGSAALEDGVTYTVYAGGQAAGEAVDGVYPSPSIDPGVLVTTVTTESGRGSGGGWGPGGGMPGERPGGPGGMPRRP